MAETEPPSEQKEAPNGGVIGGAVKTIAPEDDVAKKESENLRRKAR